MTDKALQEKKPISEEVELLLSEPYHKLFGAINKLLGKRAISIHRTKSAFKVFRHSSVSQVCGNLDDALSCAFRLYEECRELIDAKTRLTTQTPLEKLGLSARVNNGLRRGGIPTVEELELQIEMRGTNSLLSFRNFGHISLEETLDKLKRFRQEYPADE